jgi:hypothetical protein
MNNSDMPITPMLNENGHPLHASHVCWDNKPLVSGLSKREHFAGLAMQGILSNHLLIENLECGSVDWLVDNAEIVADAILAELDKSK